MAKKWGFNELGSVASITGALLSIVALIWTVRPETIPPALKGK